MKKKLLCLLLAAVLLLTVVRAEPSICFVAMNDTVPLTLTDGAMPYYDKGKLYLPYTAFHVNPNNVGASYNAEKGTFVLFNASEMLIFDLENETYTDNRDREYSTDLTFRGGLLYVPASVASHFGLYVTLLTSRAGYNIIRFTNGEQVYDDGTFVAQAENLINHVAQQHENQTSVKDPIPGIDPVDPNQGTEIETGPVEIYMAFAGDAVSKETLHTLSDHDLHAAFFLTEEQFVIRRDLVRAIYAGGHTIGLTVSDGEDVQASLDRANDAMDSVLFCRSVWAMLPQHLAGEEMPYHILTEPAAMPTVEEVLNAPEEPHLYIIRSGAPGIIESFVSAEAALPQLLETTF